MSKKQPHVPPLKVHVNQESALTLLWRENDDVKACYNMAAAVVLLMASTIMINYYIDPKIIQEEFYYLGWVLKNFWQMVLIWALTKSSSFIVFYVAKYYNNNAKAKLSPVVTIYTCWFIGVLLLPLPFIVYGDFSVILRFAFMMEQSRILMKVHGFMAEATWMTTKEKGQKITRKHFVYYLFAPTLVFRTEYPKIDKEVNWNRVLHFGLQFWLTVVVTFYTLPYFVRNNFSRYGTGVETGTAYMNKLLMGCLMGTQILFSIWFGILHCWSNMFAEAMNFGDRKFYEKWWLLGSYAKYYREWNIVVHDWLHTYWYREVIMATNGNRALGAIATFLLSAIFHELIITISLGFYYPVLFAMYVGLGIGIYFISLKFPQFNATFGNIFLFYSVIMGWSFQICFYSSEYYARINCPQIHSFWVDKLYPRSWTCF